MEFNALQLLWNYLQFIKYHIKCIMFIFHSIEIIFGWMHWVIAQQHSFFVYYFVSLSTFLLVGCQCFKSIFFVKIERVIENMRIVSTSAIQIYTITSTKVFAFFVVYLFSCITRSVLKFDVHIRVYIKYIIIGNIEWKSDDKIMRSVQYFLYELWSEIIWWRCVKTISFSEILGDNSVMFMIVYNWYHLIYRTTNYENLFNWHAQN